MKFKALKVVSLALLVSVFTACSSGEQTAVEPKEEPVAEEPKADAVDYSGTYVGTYWKEEVKGVTLEEAKEKIETTLTLDAAGVITDANIDFLVKKDDGSWILRDDTNAEVSVDFSVTPTIATPENGDAQKYAAGNSMFTVKTNDMMSFYSAAVAEDGTVAFIIVEPYTRYRFEYKMGKDFDFSTKLADMTVGNGLAIPTVRESSGAKTKPTNWEEFAANSIMDFSLFGKVITDRGVFQGLSEDSTMQEWLEKAGVTFADGAPTPMEPVYGFHSNGGWTGNYEAIAQNIIGKNATEFTSYIDWSVSRYQKGINADNFFGYNKEEVTGATNTVQDSFSGITGATVRLSREATSYQRALVEAGILKEEDVIKGRF